MQVNKEHACQSFCRFLKMKDDTNLLVFRRFREINRRDVALFSDWCHKDTTDLFVCLIKTLNNSDQQSRLSFSLKFLISIIISDRKNK